MAENIKSLAIEVGAVANGFRFGRNKFMKTVFRKMEVGVSSTESSLSRMSLKVTERER